MIYKIEDFEKYFNSAINSNIARNITTKQLEFITKWYFEETGNEISTRYKCKDCLLDIYKEIGEYYLTKQNNLEELILENELPESKLEEIIDNYGTGQTENEDN